MFLANSTLSEELVNLIEQIALIPDLHFPTSKSKAYVHLRDSISFKYGIITTVFTSIVVLALPILSWINQKYIFKCFSSNFFTRNRFLRKVSQNFLYHYTTIKNILFWGISLSILSFVQLDNDLIFLGKRLGRVCTVCLTTVLFLSLRPSPLPKILYLSLLPIHKWLSRIIILQALGHSTIYICYFYHKNTWSKLYKWENIYGVIAMIGFIIIFITSIFRLRRWSYRVFYINHYVWTWIIVITLQFHARPGIGPYTIFNSFILFYQILYRVMHTKITKINVINISPNLSIINIPSDSLTNIAVVPGSHLRLCEYKSNFISRFLLNLSPLCHPYTIASLPTDKYQRLIVRKTNFKLDSFKKYLITGAFEPMLPFISPKRHRRDSLWNRLNDHRPKPVLSLPFFNNQISPTFNISMNVTAKKILIVVGGSAISFGLPILRVMNYNGIPCKLIWVIRDVRDVKILKFFPASGDCIEVYVTGNTYDSKSSKVSTNDASPFQNYGSINNEEDLENDASFNRDFNLADDLLNEDENENVEIDFNDNCDFKNPEDGQFTNTGNYNQINFNNDIFTNQDHNNIENENISYNDIVTIGGSASTKDVHSLSSDERIHHHDIKLSSVSNDHLQPQQNHLHHLPSMQSRNEIFDTIPSSIKSYVPLGVTVFKGRPKLGGSLYDWCSDESCVGPVEIDGNSICCRDYRKKSISNLRDVDEFQNEKYKSNVWVIGAGPAGLVSNVSAWARDNGLHFHAESFSL